ncbi:hypothetical protein G3N57_00515 [Paraburkholderia sp. Se-20369]|nr:hypothetical protein [Paraburkholderia sp. Se-20369]
MSFIDHANPDYSRPTPLLSALRRVGKRLPIVHDVEGYFTPNPVPMTGFRLFGMLETRDAKVMVGFDRAKVALPSGPGPLRVSGKMWLGERTSTVTLMVSQYTVLEVDVRELVPDSVDVLATLGDA